MNPSTQTDLSGTALFKLHSGQCGTILAFNGGRQMRQSLNQVGIHIGDPFSVVRGAHLGGPMIIQINSAQIALGRGMAEKIVVKLSTAHFPEKH